MTDGLKNVHREAIIATIAANDRVERAVLFGSRATGTNTVSSDVDIALFGDRLTLTDQARLAAVLDEIPMAQSVDLLLYNSIQDRTLREHIKRQGVALYARPSPRPSSHLTRAMTNTGAAIMPNDVETACRWRRRHVGDLIRDGLLVVGDGYRAKNSELAGSGLPFARAGNIADGFQFSDTDRFPEDRLHRVGAKASRPGDVVFTSKGTVGRFAFVRRDTKPFVYSPQLCFWRSLERGVIDSYFLYCWVRGPEFFGQFRGVSGQTDMAEYVSLTDQRRMFITLPPVSEQRAIAHVLGTLDDKIELNRRMNATLEGMARALFRSWFVDFDPVRAKMEGRDTGLPKDIADLFPDRLVDSELGEIPEGWPLVPLTELIEVNPSRSLRRGEIAPYLDMANMPTCGHAPDSVVQRRFNSGMRYANGDTLLARITPCLENGKTAYVDFLRDDEIGWGSTEYIVMNPRHPLPSEFAYFLARTARFREFAIQNMSGTSGRQRVPTAALSGFSMPSPPAPVGTAFGRAARSLLRRARTAGDECRVLANCRDALLPKLVSGQVRVKTPRSSSEQSRSGDTAQRTGSEGALTTDRKKHARIGT